MPRWYYEKTQTPASHLLAVQARALPDIYCTSGVQTGKKEAAGKAAADLVWCQGVRQGISLGQFLRGSWECGEVEKKEVVG